MNNLMCETTILANPKPKSTQKHYGSSRMDYSLTALADLNHSQLSYAHWATSLVKCYVYKNLYFFKTSLSYLQLKQANPTFHSKQGRTNWISPNTNDKWVINSVPWILKQYSFASKLPICPDLPVLFYTVGPSCFDPFTFPNTHSVFIFLDCNSKNFTQRWPLLMIYLEIYCLLLPHAKLSRRSDNSNLNKH